MGRLTERPFTTGLFLLRCYQIGLRLSDLDCLEMGMVVDMLTESGNDNEKYRQLATQEDFDRF